MHFLEGRDLPNRPFIWFASWPYSRNATESALHPSTPYKTRRTGRSSQSRRQISDCQDKEACPVCFRQLSGEGRARDLRATNALCGRWRGSSSTRPPRARPAQPEGTPRCSPITQLHIVGPTEHLKALGANLCGSVWRIKITK